MKRASQNNSTATKPTSPAVSPQGLHAPGAPASGLATLLQAMLKEHETLLAIASDIRTAIRSADPDALRASVSRQALTLERITDLERERSTLVAAAGNVKRQDATKPLRLTDLAHATPEPQRGQLVALADRVRDVVEKVRDEQRVLGASMSSLAGHAEGIMRTMSRSMSRAQTYSHAGVIEAKNSVVGGLDLKT